MKQVLGGLRGPPRSHAKGQLIRYGVVVGTGYLLAIGIYSAELHIGVPPLRRTGVAFFLNSRFNFVLLRLWAFPPLLPLALASESASRCGSSARAAEQR